MKKTLTYIASGLTFLGLALPAFAQTNVNPCASGQFSALCNLDSTKIGSVISTAVTIILIIATIIALFFLIWGGIRWITSQGDKAKVEGARNTIIGAIIGLVITFLAYFILTIILGFFGLSLTNLQLPKFTG
jgi:hypothetical protein